MNRVVLRLSVYLLLICCALPMMAQSADSIVPGMVKFAGTLNEASGKPLTGTVGVTFLLYKEQSGGAPLWMETQNVQADRNGHYSVLLGSATKSGIPADAFAAGEARWIGVKPSEQDEQPRVELVSVPYALKAADAQTLGGLPASAFLLAPAATKAGDPANAETQTAAQPNTGTTPVTTAGGTVQALAKFDANSDITSSQIFDTGKNVGIGTSTPKAKLDVKGAGIVHGALTLPATGTASATAGQNSQPLNLAASVFDSRIGQGVNETFRWQTEPVANNTINPLGQLNLLFGSGANTPAETGLSVSSQGLITFAPGQTFPGTGTGNGTVTSVGLSAPSSDFSVSGSPVTSSGTLNLQWLVAPTASNVANAIVKRGSDGSFATNTMTANQVSAANSLFGNLFLSPIIAESTASGQVQATGIVGLARATGGFGVFGRAQGDGVGVVGHTNSSAGQGVRGESFATQVSANGFGPDGVEGISHADAGSGVAAFNTAGGDALFAQSNTGFAGFFLGSVDVLGNLAKASGSFKIDHPLDPANKYLYHSFVESPDMMNIYDGNVITDAQGVAIVEMPEWFEALNRDFRYQLTVIGQFAQVIVASEIVNHKFAIHTDKPNVKVSWQVTGIRQDAWANAHRIPVEQAKPDKERGLYLHPELFGAPAEKSIAAARHPGAMKLMKEGVSRRTLQ